MNFLSAVCSLQWDNNNVTSLQISFEEVFCAGYLLSELVVREEETQIW